MCHVKLIVIFKDLHRSKHTDDFFRQVGRYPAIDWLSVNRLTQNRFFDTFCTIHFIAPFQSSYNDGITFYAKKKYLHDANREGISILMSRHKIDK